jgi:hypothetical protein
VTLSEASRLPQLAAGRVQTNPAAQGLFGRTFQLEVRREIGEGTPVTMRIPLTEQSSSRLRLNIPAFTLPLV